IEGLACYDYRTDRLVAVVPRRHPLRGRSVSFARLLDFDLVGLESNTAMSQLLASRATAAGKPLRLRVQVNGFDVLAKLVQAGLGIGVLPELAARAFVRPLGLRLVPIAAEWAPRPPAGAAPRAERRGVAAAPHPRLRARPPAAPAARRAPGRPPPRLPIRRLT